MLGQGGTSCISAQAVVAKKFGQKVLSPYINWNIRLDLFMIQIYSDIHLQKKSRMTHPVKWYITIMHITLNSQLHAKITDLSLSLSISKYAPYDFFVGINVLDESLPNSATLH